jgi:hypothetical protein
MSRFADVLRGTHERLLIPQPARSRVLLEIRADMEDLYAAYLDRGLSAEEAERRTVQECDLSDETLAALAEIHGGPWRRLLDGLSRQARSRVERSMLAVLLVFVALVGGGFLRGADIVRDAGPVAWPVMAALVLGLAVGAVRLYDLHLRQDHDPRRLRRGLNVVIGAAVAQPVVALTGNGIALFAANLRLITDFEAGGPVLMGWLIAAAATLIIALTGSILCALLWYLAETKVASIESDEAAWLADLAA